MFLLALFLFLQIVSASKQTKPPFELNGGFVYEKL